MSDAFALALIRTVVMSGLYNANRNGLDLRHSIWICIWYMFCMYIEYPLSLYYEYEQWWMILLSKACIVFLWISFLLLSITFILIIKIDKIIINYISFLLIGHKYNDHYQSLNGPPPSNVYALNCQYSNIYNCQICLDKFCKLTNGKETLLHCGHRYHNLCLQRWEQSRLYADNKYQCPLCRKRYYWTQKYDYIYTISI